MLSGRRRSLKTLALLLPANMLWVVVACTIQCIAASEIACAHEPEPAATCCAADETERSATDLEDVDSLGCRISSNELAVLSNGSPQRGGVHDPAVVSARVLLPSASAAARDVPPRSAGPPPLGRPLDRIPVLLI